VGDTDPNLKWDISQSQYQYYPKPNWLFNHNRENW
jgi:hypothetical protein